MKNDVVYLTSKGREELEKKLEELKVVRRREVAEKIKIAREFGDISENSEYDAAKEEQAMVEGEILDIENRLRIAVTIEDDKLGSGIVSVGSKVKIKDYEENVELVYQIVGTTEADIANGKISNESPVGRGLLGKKKNSDVVIDTPGGKLKFKILDIE